MKQAYNAPTPAKVAYCICSWQARLRLPGLGAGYMCKRCPGDSMLLVGVSCASAKNEVSLLQQQALRATLSSG